MINTYIVKILSQLNLEPPTQYVQYENENRLSSKPNFVMAKQGEYV